MTELSSSPTLVTGASGFAGGHLIDRLAEPSLVGWHRPGTTPAAATSGLTWQGVDLLDRESVAEHIAALKPVRIYHLAGAPRADATWDHAIPHFQANVLGTHHLLEAVRLAGHSCRVLVVSSGLVYRAQSSPLDEESPLVPETPYGLSKLAQEQLALHAWRSDALDVVVARPFTHIGPRQRPDFSVASFARQIALIDAGRADPVVHVGNLETRRDFTDVRDVVAGYQSMMARGITGRAYNVCSGRAVRVSDVLDALVRMSRVPLRIIVDADRMRSQDPPIIVGNAARLQRELGWTTQFSLEHTLRDTFEWWRRKVAVGTGV